MSWITGLADKAENILNKLDQNAATALQTPIGTPPTTTITSTSEISNEAVDVLRKSFSTSSLSLAKSLSPKRALPRNESPSKPAPNLSDFNEASNLSSRRSSLSSRPDSVTIDIPLPSEKSIEPSKADLSPGQELAAFKIALADVSSERDELKTKLLALTDSSQQAAMKGRLSEMEIFIHRLTNERDQIQNELLDTQAVNKGYMHSISQLESSISKIQQEFIDVSQKLQMQVKETEQQRLDLLEYRKKAQLALQMKDQMIAELKTSGSGHNETSDHSNERILQLEMNTLKQENQQYQEEIQNVRLQLENSKDNLHSICRQHEETVVMLRMNDDTLRKEVRSEKEHTLQLESELRVVNQELLATRNQVATQMGEFSVKIQEKEAQLERMKASYAAAQADPSTYETRLRSLTQALVEKQNSVEAVTAERNALKLQLEKTESQLRLSAFNTRTEGNTLTLVNHTDDAKAQFPLLMRENPFDNRVARRVKRAYSTLDSAGIRLGVFLRRYPLIRIVVLMYVTLLHLWVMFVLLSSTPT